MPMWRHAIAVLALLSLSGPALAKRNPAEAGPEARTRPALEARAAAALISQYRAAHGLGPVRIDRALNGPAEYQARAVAQLGSLSHGDFAARMASFGIRGKAAENLSAGLDSVEQVIAQWQASSGHNANLLTPDFTRIGLARAHSDRSYWALVLAR
jgi:uncharacterized protein YkwD